MTPLTPVPADRWVQGTVVPLTITALTNRGDGIGHLDGRAVFVPDTVPGDEIRARLVRVKSSHGFGTLESILQQSPQRVRPACIVADKCGGCQWQCVDYPAQLDAKAQMLRDTLERIGNLAFPIPEPALGAPSPLRYRNKATYPVASGSGDALRVGYYRKGSHRLVNLNQCPVQDERFDRYLQGIKQDLNSAGWTAYNERSHQGVLRHVGLRIGRRTGEVLLTLVVKDARLSGIDTWAERWLDRYDDLVGVCLNVNPDRTNAIFGAETRCLAGRPALRELFAGLTLHVDSTSFFQVYTEQAERLFNWVVDRLDLQGTESVVDAYCGIGTLSLPLAQKTRRVIGIESLPAAVHQARGNAQFNRVENVEFVQGAVEDILPSLETPDIVLLDPPRKGCDARVLETLGQKCPQRIVYISCNPATLARDLQQLTASGHYTISCLRAADFFPQTPHVETIAFLTRP
jgi:23S rRNA (uracil1939-C5)-methyltransferase